MEARLGGLWTRWPKEEPRQTPRHLDRETDQLMEGRWLRWLIVSANTEMCCPQVAQTRCPLLVCHVFVFAERHFGQANP